MLLLSAKPLLETLTIGVIALESTLLPLSQPEAIKVALLAEANALSVTFI
jgi:hypothetical protein